MLNRFLFLVPLICALRGLSAISVDTEPSIDLEGLRKAKSEEIRKYMNETADPCEDFFDFACGNWKTYYPGNSTAESQLSNYGRHTLDFYNELLQRLKMVHKNDSVSVRKVKNFYNSCLNFTTDRSNFKDTVRQLANEFHQMPALVGDKWPEDDFDWLQVVAQIYYKYDKIIIMGPEIIGINEDQFLYGIRIANEMKTLNISTLKRYLTTYLDVDNRTANEIALETYDFELSLLKASEANYMAEEIDTVQEFHDKYPDLDIKRLMTISFGYIPTDEVTSYNIEELIDVMKKTPKKVVANYISLSLLDELLSDIVTKKSDCDQEMLDNFPDILSSMFYRTQSVKKQEQYIEQMWQVVKPHFQMVLESSALYWFDEKYRELSLEKLHWLKLILPSHQDRDFDEVYDQLHINPTDYIENRKALKAFNTIKFRKSLNTTDSSYLPLLQKSLFYHPLENKIGITMSAVTSDFMLSPSLPNAYNYGRFGYGLFHEVTHAFSGLGRQFNKLGYQTGKWDVEIEREFSKRKQCLYDQYTNHTFKGKPLPQDPMQQENAADNAGILLAHQAYRKWYEDSARTKDELDMETLPNLNYTNMQLFFITVSQTWCADTFEIDVTEPHSPHEFRAFVPLKNIDAFAKVFKCPKGSPMNPIKKCRIY